MVIKLPSPGFSLNNELGVAARGCLLKPSGTYPVAALLEARPAREGGFHYTRRREETGPSAPQVGSHQWSGPGGRWGGLCLGVRARCKTPGAHPGSATDAPYHLGRVA